MRIPKGQERGRGGGRRAVWSVCADDFLFFGVHVDRKPIAAVHLSHDGLEPYRMMPSCLRPAVFATRESGREVVTEKDGKSGREKASLAAHRRKKEKQQQRRGLEGDGGEGAWGREEVPGSLCGLLELLLCQHRPPLWCRGNQLLQQPVIAQGSQEGACRVIGVGGVGIRAWEAGRDAR